MDILILGSGMMGQAIVHDLITHSNFNNITIADKSKTNLDKLKNHFETKNIKYIQLDIKKIDEVKKLFLDSDVVISAIPYYYNYELTKIAISTRTHFLDLGGNNQIVDKQRSLIKEAKQNDVIIIPDCGLAPGITSTITRDIVENLTSINYVKIRVGGLPINPKPPLNYQIVFSPNGLINEYVEDSLILQNGDIIYKKSMTEIEKIIFPKPFGELEAFLTSGGCSTLPYSYKDKIDYLDYKTIRYLGHCDKFNLLLDFFLGDENNIKINDINLNPRDIFIEFLKKNLPINQRDVVLLKVFTQGKKNGNIINMNYTLIDYYDLENNLTAMMRTTGFPISIIAQMIERNIITKKGVYCPEEIVPCKIFFDELKKRNILIKKEIYCK